MNSVPGRTVALGRLSQDAIHDNSDVTCFQMPEGLYNISVMYYTEVITLRYPDLKNRVFFNCVISFSLCCTKGKHSHYFGFDR